MPRNKTLKCICQYCAQEFVTYPRYKRSSPKYCSISCGISARNKSWAISPQEVFYKNISNEHHKNGCWIYLVGSRYGKMKIGEKYISAHRYSYELHYGYIPDDAYICHKCDVTQCVNPSHLWIGNAKENRQDMLYKERGNFKKGSSHHNSKLNESQVYEIKKRLKLDGVTKLAKEFNVSHCLIDQIRSGRSWKHIVIEDKES